MTLPHSASALPEGDGHVVTRVYEIPSNTSAKCQTLMRHKLSAGSSGNSLGFTQGAGIFSMHLAISGLGSVLKAGHAPGLVETIDNECGQVDGNSGDPHHLPAEE